MEKKKLKKLKLSPLVIENGLSVEQLANFELRSLVGGYGCANDCCPGNYCGAGDCFEHNCDWYNKCILYICPIDVFDPCPIDVY